MASYKAIEASYRRFTLKGDKVGKGRCSKSVLARFIPSSVRMENHYMNTREFAIAVQEQLKSEGFSDFRLGKQTQSRFYAVDQDGNQYDFRVKYCIKPRKLYMADVGFMAGSANENIPAVLVTNGTDITKQTRKCLEDKGMKIVLDWQSGQKIIG